MRISSHSSLISAPSLSLSALSPTCVTGLLAHQPRTYAIPKWAIPRACRNADFTWSGQLGGSGTEDKLGSIRTVIAQAGPGIKGSKGGQRLSTNVGASGLACGRISAGSGQNDLCKNAGPGQHHAT
jgi:hypothetical protein